jgi:hypothetical protein
VTTLLGAAICERAYYYCAGCHAGCFPTDAEFGLEHHQTPGAREVISLMGVLEPFEEGAHDVLPRLSGLNVSASTVQRTAEATGADIAARRAAGETFGPEQVWDWHRDASGHTVAYVGADATGVRQQGPHGEKAEGRMPNVATVFNPQPTHETRRRRRMWDSRYVSGLLKLDEIGRQLRRECQAVGVDRADRVIALTDGGAGLENCLTDALGGLAQEIVFILDFWHASDHLQEFANLFAAHEEQRQTWVAAQCHRLKHEGGQALLNDLEALDLDGVSETVREGHRLLTGYVRSNLHRMEYPQYIANGWQIGSGKVESACKSVVATRLKGPGMRWREPGTTALCQLRALYKSQPTCWRHYWNGITAA